MAQDDTVNKHCQAECPGGPPIVNKHTKGPVGAVPAIEMLVGSMAPTARPMPAWGIAPGKGTIIFEG